MLFLDGISISLAGHFWMGVSFGVPVFFLDGISTSFAKYMVWDSFLIKSRHCSQVVGPAVQVFAISVGTDGCPFCDAIICQNQGVHLNFPEMHSIRYIYVCVCTCMIHYRDAYDEIYIFVYVYIQYE